MAEPVVKIINFTADWCPNCRLLNTRLDTAIEQFPAGKVERIDLDMTAAGRGATLIERGLVETQARDLAADHGAAYLWNWYGGITGLAVAIAADTGEPIVCFMRPMKADDIEKRLHQAILMTEHAKPHRRSPEGPDCPSPKRG